MKSMTLLAVLFLISGDVAATADAPPIVIIDSATPAKEVTCKPGGTFVMPEGFTGIRDIHERMKKQHIKIRDPNAKLIAEPVLD